MSLVKNNLVVSILFFMAIKDSTGKIIDKCLRVFTANIIFQFVSEHEICFIKYKTDYHEKQARFNSLNTTTTEPYASSYIGYMSCLFN